MGETQNDPLNYHEFNFNSNVWSWAMLGHPVDSRIVGAGVSFCSASVLKHVSN